MRALAMMSVLGRALHRQIFAPTYLFRNDTELRDLLSHQVRTDARKERFCRGLLLSMFENEQLVAGEERVAAASREVNAPLRQLLAQASVEDFQPMLTKLLQTGLRLWFKLQRSEEKFESSLDLDVFPDWDWHEPEENSSQVLREEDTFMVVFPRIYTITEDEYTPIFAGVAIGTTQTIAAAKEVERIKVSMAMAKRIAPSRRRSARGTFMDADANGNGQAIRSVIINGHVIHGAIHGANGNANGNGSGFGSPLGSPMGNPIGSPIGNQMDSPMSSPMASPMGKPMGNSMNSPMTSPTGNSMGKPMTSPLGSPTGKPMAKPIGNSNSSSNGNSNAKVVALAKVNGKGKGSAKSKGKGNAKSKGNNNAKVNNNDDAKVIGNDNADGDGNDDPKVIGNNDADGDSNEDAIDTDSRAENETEDGENSPRFLD